MELREVYRYAVGRIEELKEGNLDRMPNARTLRELEVDFSEEGILIPRFVGIYQRIEPIAENFDETLEKDEVMKKIGALKNILDFVTSLSLSFGGYNDSVNPDLIHIGYDEKIWPNAKIVRQAFAVPMGRIRFSKLECLPDFRAKNCEFIRRVVTNAEESLKTREDVEKLFKEYAKGHPAQMREFKAFGLTRAEYSLIGKF